MMLLMERLRIAYPSAHIESDSDRYSPYLVPKYISQYGGKSEVRDYLV